MSESEQEPKIKTFEDHDEKQAQWDREADEKEETMRRYDEEKSRMHEEKERKAEEAARKKIHQTEKEPEIEK